MMLFVFFLIVFVFSFKLNSFRKEEETYGPKSKVM